MSPDELIELYATTREELRVLFFETPQTPYTVRDDGKIVMWADNHRDAYVRLGQSHFALKHFRALERVTDPSMSGLGDHADAMRFFAEAFYYFAFRFREVIRAVHVRQSDGRTDQPFATVKARGVRIARNHLIEHPEKGPDGRYVTQFRFDCPEGLVLQWGEAPHDAGLYPNAAKLIHEVRSRMHR